MNLEDYLMRHSTFMRARLLVMALSMIVCCGLPMSARGEDVVEADLLIVGGTESACAAAVQAARMDVERIVLVNDIAWLGGQFSAECVSPVARLPNR